MKLLKEIEIPEINFKNTIGDKLKFIRNSYNISIKDLTKLLKVSEKTYNNYERNITLIKPNQLSLIADKFNIPKDFLLNNANEILIVFK